MKLKSGIISLGLVTCVFYSTFAYSTGSVLLNNDTSCKITKKDMQIIKKETVSAVEFSTFYYTKPQDPSSLVYYTTILPNSSAKAFIGDYGPSSGGINPTMQLGYSRSTGYTTGSAQVILESFTPKTRYIYQYVDQSDAAIFCKDYPCLGMDTSDPCSQ